MSEWLKEHAWKLNLFRRSDAHQNAPTHVPPITSRNIDVHRRVPVTDGVCPGFQGVCDTVLTQFADSLAPVHLDVLQYASIGADSNAFAKHPAEFEKNDGLKKFEDQLIVGAFCVDSRDGSLRKSPEVSPTVSSRRHTLGALAAPIVPCSRSCPPFAKDGHESGSVPSRDRTSNQHHMIVNAGISPRRWGRTCGSPLLWRFLEPVGNLDERAHD